MNQNHKQMKEILESILYEMPQVFTSNYFCKVARKKGVHENIIVNGGIAAFLWQNCDPTTSTGNGTRTRTWLKKNQTTLINKVVADDNDIQKAIKLLKDNGYKIMMVKQEFVEV